jgi:hypothetical protein
MKIKRFVLASLVLVLCLSLAAAPRGRKTARLQFHQGDKFLTPQIGLNSYTVPLGVNFESAITANIGVGGTVMMWVWSHGTIIMPSVDGAYHFTQLDADKLDLFAGASLGFAIFSAKEGYGGSSGLYLSPFVAGRYWFSGKMAVSLRLNFSVVGDWKGLGGLLGVTFPI